MLDNLSAGGETRARRETPLASVEKKKKEENLQLSLSGLAEALPPASPLSPSPEPVSIAAYPQTPLTPENTRVHEENMRVHDRTPDRTSAAEILKSERPSPIRIEILQGTDVSQCLPGQHLACSRQQHGSQPPPAHPAQPGAAGAPSHGCCCCYWWWWWWWWRYGWRGLCEQKRSFGTAVTFLSLSFRAPLSAYFHFFFCMYACVCVLMRVTVHTRAHTHTHTHTLSLSYTLIHVGRKSGKHL